MITAPLKKAQDMVRNILFLGSFIFATCFCSPAFGQEEANVDKTIRCKTDVSFTWRRQLTKEEINDAIRSRKELEPPKPQSVFFRQITEAGMDEAALKRAIEEQKNRAVKEATEHCKKFYVSKSNCVAEGLKKMQEDMAFLDFESRKTFLEALKNDCEKSVGECLDASATPVTCEKPAEAVEGEEGKDAKKKK